MNFTDTHTVIVVLIFIAIVTSFAIIDAEPIIIEHRKRQEIYKKQQSLLGKSLVWENQKIVITKFNDNDFYILVLPKNDQLSLVTIKVDATIILNAYESQNPEIKGINK